MHFLFTGLSQIEMEPIITCTRIAREDPKESREFVSSCLLQNCVTEAGGAPCLRWYGHCRLSWAGSSSHLSIASAPQPMFHPADCSLHGGLAPTAPHCCFHSRSKTAQAALPPAIPFPLPEEPWLSLLPSLIGSICPSGQDGSSAC